jgi:hypothetical protein
MTECCADAGVENRAYVVTQLVLEHRHDEPFTVASGENLKAGAPVGLPDGGTEILGSVQTAADGSQKPVGVLLCDVDATAAAVEGVNVLTEGKVNFDAMVLDASWTFDNMRDALKHNRGLYVEQPVWAGETP